MDPLSGLRVQEVVVGFVFCVLWIAEGNRLWVTQSVFLSLNCVRYVRLHTYVFQRKAPVLFWSLPPQTTKTDDERRPQTLFFSCWKKKGFISTTVHLFMVGLKKDKSFVAPALAR